MHGTPVLQFDALCDAIYHVTFIQILKLAHMVDVILILLSFCYGF